MSKTFFAPQLFIPSGVMNTDFYQNAFGAVELRRWNNDDGSIHVAELSIDGALFHLHEVVTSKNQLHPEKAKATTVIVGLFVPNVDAVMKSAEAAGATVVMPAQDFDYAYRQGELKDPYGHLWLIEKKI